MAARKSLDLLPIIFQTDANKKFLSATIDQLISEPVLKTVNGYIGRKFAPTYKNKDSYVTEASSDRQNYQLEPSIVIRNANDDITFFSSYIDLLNKIDYYGGLTNNHSRLFDSEYYSFDPKISFDKFVNFSQYYWLPNGPDAVDVNTTGVELEKTYEVARNIATKRYTFSSVGATNNTITLARGGVYTFVVDQPGVPFWIQSELGIDGLVNATPTISTRDVLGVTNNGTDIGTITFAVPPADAQDRFTKMPTVANVDYAAPLPYSKLHNKLLSEFLAEYPQYAGITGQLDGKTLIFVDEATVQESLGESAWTSEIVRDDNGTEILGYGEGEVVPDAQRYGVWKVIYFDIGQSTPLVRLEYVLDVNYDEKVYIKTGIGNANKEFYKEFTGFFVRVPHITSIQDTLYIQDGIDPSIYTFVKIVDPIDWSIDVERDILGKQEYTSPNGIEFTSGLKIKFDTDVTPEQYQNKTYYVENTGDSIRLIDVDLLVTPESYNDELAINYPLNRVVLDTETIAPIPAGTTISIGGNDIITDTDVPIGRSFITTLSSVSTLSLRSSVSGVGIANGTVVVSVRADTVFPEYVTIKRDALDLNAWSRNNRWFHRDVITKTAEYNSTTIVFDQNLRAQRPIVQFEGDLQLFNYGRIGKKYIDVLDTTTLNAFNEFEGKVLTRAFGVELYDGLRVLFAADEDPLVRDKIYVVNLVQYDYDEELRTPTGDIHIKLTIADDGEGEVYDSIVVTSGLYKGSQWWYDGVSWFESQQKTQLQQDPLFDVFDSTGASFSTYERSSFLGTKIFGYDRTSTGANDSILGFPLKYRSFQTQGDIEFQNYFDTDVFNYIDGQQIINNRVSSGFMHSIVDRYTVLPKNNWKTVVENSKQYQLISFVYDGSNNPFTIDVTPEVQGSIPNIKVYQNNTYLTTTVWTLVNNDLTLLTQLVVGDRIDVRVYSNQVSELGFYEVPDNLNLNAQNKDLELLTLGQLRNHLVALSQNSTNLVGNVLGPSNLRDIEIKQQGGSILQHSAPVPYSSLFLLDEQANFINALRLAQTEYARFKNKFLELSVGLPGVNPSDPVAAVDLILSNINVIKNKTFPWFYSDMVPYGTLKSVVSGPNGYTIFDPLVHSYEISKVFNDTVLGNTAIIVYLTKSGTTTKLQLLKGIHYVFRSDRPAITLLLEDFATYSEFVNDRENRIEVGDLLTIVEYSNTDGNYIPETPTKLGLYPKFTPEIFEDDTYRTPINVIRGHDGSLTPAFNDFRDNFLLELEKRIFNNIKLPDTESYQEIYSVVPGKFRNNDYSINETTQILTKSFMSWVGNNKLDFSSNNTFENNNPFTWNYTNFNDTIDGERLPGSWRACYLYFYDTVRPHQTPWEMLGFSIKPDWWEGYYGPAPYTGGNQLLWDDLEAGTIRQGSRSNGQNYTEWTSNVDYLQGDYVRYEDQFYLAPNNNARSLVFNTSEWITVDQSTIPWIPKNDTRFARLGLRAVIPVDANGFLKNPAELMVKAFNSTRAGASWAIGNIGPVENAWRNSSDYPFAIQQTLALAKPARYFGIMIDTYKHVKNQLLDQYLTANNDHINQREININGNLVNGIVVRSAGYLNWIAEYLRNQGIDPVAKITPLILNYEVNLAYKMAGFTDIKYIQILAEQSSPTSTNESVIIPNENYNIHLYKSTPINKLVYSSVIVEKTNSGYSVRGYDLNNPYFTIIPSVINSNAFNITVQNSRVAIYRDYQQLKLTIPYGYEFISQQQVADFLISYERYLLSQGFQFNDTDDILGETRNWKLSVKEFLFWAQQGWRDGSILVLSPVSETINGISIQSIVDGITDSQYGSKVLDQNFKLVKNNNYTVMRTPTEFKVSLTDTASVIGYIELDLVQYEHVLVFDNTTVFDDIIYKPELGNRQYRLKLVGQQTDSWDGSLSAPGFVYNSGVVDNWITGKDYLKGDLVQFKNQYYVALQPIVANNEFQFAFWKQIGIEEIKKGLLPNFSSIAVQSQSYYNSYGYFNAADQVKYSHGLIGFKPRQYLDDLGMNETTQIELYKGFIKQKGSLNAVNQLTTAEFNNLNSAINLYEEWAIRVGEYGALDVNPYIEIVLDEKEFSVNPAIARFVGDSNINEGNNLTVFNKSQLYKSTDQFDGTITLNRDDTSDVDNDIPTAGYVNIDDVDATIFDLANYSDLDSDLTNIGTGYTIWTAKDFNQNWNVYRVTETKNPIILLENVLDGFVTFTMSTPHGLTLGEVFLVRQFDTSFDGFYQVTRISAINKVTVRYTGPSTNLDTLTSLQGNGIFFVLDSLRFQFMEDARIYTPPDGWRVGEKIWIDLDAPTSFVQGQPFETGNNLWKVYEKTAGWEYKQNIIKGSNEYVANNGFGTSIKMSTDTQLIITGTPEKDLITLQVSAEITANVGEFLTQPSSGANLSILQNVTNSRTITVQYNNTSVLDLAGDLFVNGVNTGSLLESSNNLNGRVETFNRTIEDVYRQGVTLFPTVDNSLEFGTQVDIARTTIAVGAPGSLNNTGYVYIYNRDDGTTDINGVQILVGNTSAQDRFGQSFAFDETGSWLYVGAPGSDTVYVYGLNTQVTEEQQIESITNENTIELTGNVTVSQGDVITQPATGATIVILANASASSNVSVSNLTNIIIESELANVQISRPISANAGDFLTQISSGANITLSRDIVNDEQIIGRWNDPAAFDLSGNLYLNGNLITVTVDSVAYTVVPTASGSGNIFINNTDTGLYPSALYSEATANTIQLSFEPSITDDASSLLVKLGEKIYIPDIEYTLSGNVISFPTTLQQGDYRIVQRPYYVRTTTITGPSGSEFGYAVDSSYDGAQLAVGTPNDTVNVGVFTTTLGSTIERSIPVGTLTANITVDGNVAVLTSYAEYPGAGSVYVYDRVIEAYKSVVDAVPGTNSQEYQTTGNIGAVYRVTIDGIVTEDYSKDPAILATNTIKFNSATEIGQIIYIETNQFNLLEKLIGIDSLEGGLAAIQKGARFGTSLTICSNNCAIYVGAPYYDKDTIYNTGAVWKFHNKGRLYGVNTGQTKNPTFTPGNTIRLDNFEVTITGTTLDDVVEDINNAGILGVSAVNFNGFLRLDSDKTVAKNLLRILSGSGTVFEDAGMAVFAFMQIIVNPYSTPGENFGTRVILASNAYMLLISSETGTTRERVTFDDDTTVYDDESTVFFNDIKGSGSVYTYELYDDPRDEVEHPGRYAFAQQLNTRDLNVSDKFGAAIDIVDTTHIIVSAPGDDNIYGADSGSVHLFTNLNKVRGWKLIRYQQPKVEIESIDRVYLYNNLTNNILTNLEFIDPAKGKILGQAEQELSYKTPFDPAVYNRGTASNLNQNLFWSTAQIGKVWWNLDKIRYIDYEQDTLTYRSINWGRLFPGSVVEVAEWVESNVLPSFYTSNGGEGVPLYEDNSAYVEITYVDPITNIVSSKYYFWVKDKTTLDLTNPNRTLPISAVQDLIENPKNQDIAYAAFIRNDAFVVYNASEYLSAKNTILHLDYETVKNDNIIHSEYELIQKGNPINYVPPKIVNKLIDSLAGIDNQGAVVPDPKLSIADSFGISTRPRQSLFNDRLAALDNLISYANSVLIKKPIARQYELTQLNAAEPLPISKASGAITGEYDAVVSTEIELQYIDTAEIPTGYRILVETDTAQDNLWIIYELQADKTWLISRVQSYKTNLYWNYVDWYAEGYGPDEIIEFAVETITDAQKLAAAPGDEILVRVAAGPTGGWNLLSVNEDREFIVVGIENGTIQFNPSIADYELGSLGFGNQGFDANRFDQNPNIEIRYIIQALRDDIFINELQGEFNNLFFVMVNYLFNEQKYVDWIFKTSFVSITHQLRALDQYPNYIKDNQSYYQDYINEVKPYSTKIREYLISYNGDDEFAGSLTDFDLPPYYDTATGIFRSPSGEEPVKDQQLWATGFSGDTLVNPQYTQWYGVRNSQVIRIDVQTPGSGYTSVPTVTLTGGGGSVVAATARAVIDFDLGTVTAIEVITSGSGYETTPTVVINGSSDVPATAYAILKNNFVRSFDTTLKFDRISYGSTVSNWQPATTVLQGNIVSINGVAYRALEDVYSSAIMVLNANVSVSAGDVIGQLGYVNDSYTTSANVLYTESDSSIIVIGNIIGQFDALTSNLTINGIDANVTITNYNHLFDTTKYEVVPASDFNNANDRIMGYYSPSNTMPAKDLSQLIYGIGYPGVQVTGLPFNVAPGFDGNLDVSLFDMVDYDADGNPIVGNGAVDSAISSLYTDANLGLRPEDIDVDGGAYIDRYSSHAPEELIPGRVFDTLDMKIYTTVELSANVNTVLGYRMFVNMFEDTSFLRIADEYSTTLAQELLFDDTEIVVVDASVLSVPNPSSAIPGVIFIGSERITYYTIDLSTNTLGQLRRGTQGTTTPNRHSTGVAVIDGSLNQVIPGVSLGNVALSANEAYTVTDTVTYRLTLSSNISANIGDIITQTTSSANVTVLGANIQSTNTLLVTYNSLADFNFANVILGNIAINGVHTVNVYPVSSNIAGYGLSDTGAVLVQQQHLVSGTTGKLSAKLQGDLIGNILTTANINHWYNNGDHITVSTDGSGFEGATTSAVMFLKSSPATNLIVATIADLLTTEDAINTLITEDGQQILEE